MNIILPLQTGTRTKLYVTNITPIIGLPYGCRIPEATILENKNEKLYYDVSGLYLVDYTLGDSWYEGSIVVAK
ncbi:hypothetical protein [Calidifontibacillus oryziterrae]|uniref:hypothetical protein n=1 Tax=Calidifontibacillus oryziterrae TaxID=1191699 RepID=UPI00030E3225|nr:hypothetical protein [Calidifontibacillus oryziterrae]